MENLSTNTLPHFTVVHARGRGCIISMLTKCYITYCRGVATCTHGHTCVPEKMLDLFVAHAHRKKNKKKLFQSLLGRTIERYFFAYKQLSNLLSLYSYPKIFLSLSGVIVRVSVVLKRTVGDSD